MFLFAISISSSAQSFQQGDKLLNIGVGFSSGLAGMSIPPVSASYEVGITDNISVGAYGGLYSISSSVAGFKSSTMSIAALGRAAYHHDFGVENLDTYAGLMAGAGITLLNSNIPALDNSTNVGFGWGAFLGARYYFTQSMSAFTELGAGFTNVTVGISFKM